MTRTLFLHVGPAKTGTSAVQHILQRHDNSIVIYPKVGLWADGSHHNLVLNFFGQYTRPEVVREDAAGLITRVGKEAKRSDRDIVISSEILAGRRDVTGFSAALEREIGEPLRVEVVAVVREHFERAASLYNQRVKDAVTGETRDPDAFLAAHAHGLCYGNFLKRFRKTAFEITVINYHPAENCVERVLAHFGLTIDGDAHLAQRNVSLSRKALVACLAANRTAREVQERNRFLAGLRRMPDFYAPAGLIFGDDAIFRAEQKFQKDRNYLLRRFDVEVPLPDLSEHRAPFAISRADYNDICDIAAGFGAFGQAIRDAVRPYAPSDL